MTDQQATRESFEKWLSEHHPIAGDGSPWRFHEWAWKLWQAASIRESKLAEALRFYASGTHLQFSDPVAWDSVSGEQPNWLCDEAGTATVEDGTVAKQALAAHDAREGERAQPDWVTDLKRELLLSKMTHNFTLTRDELAYVLRIEWSSDPHASQPRPEQAAQGQSVDGYELEFEVWQNDECVAGGNAPTLAMLLSEADHYIAMYGQDGPAKATFYMRKEVSRTALEFTAALQPEQGESRE